MRIESTIKIITKPKVDGEIVLHLNPREAFILGMLVGDIKYESAVKTCNKDMMLKYPEGKIEIDLEECTNFLSKIYGNIYDEFKH